jgi:hypothetical protein
MKNILLGILIMTVACLQFDPLDATWYMGGFLVGFGLFYIGWLNLKEDGR